jgi:hypothetical protein
VYMSITICLQNLFRTMKPSDTCKLMIGHEIGMC